MTDYGILAYPEPVTPLTNFKIKVILEMEGRHYKNRLLMQLKSILKHKWFSIGIAYIAV